LGSGLVVIEKEMAVTHKDFFRSLPNALQEEECNVDGYSVRISGANGIWNIELGPEGTRKIAHLSLPRTKVKLIFNNYSEMDLKKVLERFDRAFQRAGG
tara:strand:- start:1154 stop:1450 length:297 start_codon:yes stop_codon:yes gene_type:complete